MQHMAIRKADPLSKPWIFHLTQFYIEEFSFFANSRYLSTDGALIVDSNQFMGREQGHFRPGVPFGTALQLTI